ncbi:right-handed parallel beta-helix repeat-containing protein [Bacillus glycinifermentans]|uniref:right-handed parallel beta-helix repeat-containing protein n=1 Tax=Bacillus glycinifermentans TaxID=1664069 RepID=UPI001FF30D8B|nr:right-handed parallel beta-helix repeat-containing protein [Bacillus glycinifermentans]UOY90884.1 right-handed parallel beta-helix repeat-containing protein [Bacillus glycinifermentans]
MTMTVADVTKFGAVGDGNTDCTNAINECLKWAKSMGIHTVWIPNGTYLIDATQNGDPAFPFRNAGINVPSGIAIQMDAEAVMQVKPNGSWGYSVFYIGGESNVKISGGSIIGDRDDHTYTPTPRPTHEWGFGICVEGASHVLIENVRLADFTGDGIIISAGGQDYRPSVDVTVRNCNISRSRRNNISITGCDGVLVEGCNIEDAGAGNGTAPRFGIDIEGYSEGSVFYEKPVNVTIRNNVFKGNVNSAVTNFNGASVVIEGNHADGTISYGYGAKTIIAGNVLENNPDEARPKTGIAGLGTDTLREDRDAVIKGNLITGFSTGMDIRGKSVLVSGNKINDFENAGISVYAASQVFIEGNDIENGVPEKKKSVGFSVIQSDRITFSNNSITGVILGVRSSGDDVQLKQNVIKLFSRGVWISQGNAVIEGNFISPASFQIVPESYSLSVTDRASAVIQNNTITGFKNFAIYCSTEKETKIFGNMIEDSSLVVTIYMTLGTHEFIGNTVSLVREERPAIILYISQSTGSLIMNNTIHSRSADGITAIQTDASTQSRIIGNTVVKGTIHSHQTDVVKGNIIV